jgi:predicted nucleic acid-binding protein
MQGGRAREIIFSERYILHSPQATLFEVAKHLPWLAGKLRKPELDIFHEFQLRPISDCQPMAYDHQVRRATELIGRRDPHDIPLLALALARDYAIWSDDRDFEGIAEVRVFKTAELFARIQQ